MAFGKREKIAVIGGGAAGLGAAWRLAKKYDVTIYEADPHLGGHAYAHPFGDTGVHVDMGVMITLPWAYPNLYCMFQRYGVRTRAAAASLLVSFPGRDGDEEVWGTDGFFRNTKIFERFEAQASRFEQLMFEIAALPMEEQLKPIREYLTTKLPDLPHSGGYDDEFLFKGLCPLLSLFLVTRRSLLDTPAWSLSMMFRFATLSFFSPTSWRTIDGGTRDYVARLTRSFQARRLTETKVLEVVRSGSDVRVRDAKGGNERYDHVVFATGADKALEILGADATSTERELLSGFAYQPAVAYLHSDESVLSEKFDPRLFFQYQSENPNPGQDLDGVVTYNMKHCSGLDAHEGAVLVSVYSETPPKEPEGYVVKRDFSHLVPDAEAMKRRLLLHKIQGVKRTWFCGDYATFSSHEDAFTSGMVVSEALGVDYPFRTHPVASYRFFQNRLLMMPRLGLGTRMPLQARWELLRDSLDVLYQMGRDWVFKRVPWARNTEK